MLERILDKPLEDSKANANPELQQRLQMIKNQINAKKEAESAPAKASDMPLVQSLQDKINKQLNDLENESEEEEGSEEESEEEEDEQVDDDDILPMPEDCDIDLNEIYKSGVGFLQTVEDMKGEKTVPSRAESTATSETKTSE